VLTSTSPNISPNNNNHAAALATRRWLEGLGLESLCDSLINEHGYTTQDLVGDADLDHDALKELGVAQRGLRVRLLKAVAEARKTGDTVQRTPQRKSNSFDFGTVERVSLLHFPSRHASLTQHTHTSPGLVLVHKSGS